MKREIVCLVCNFLFAVYICGLIGEIYLAWTSRQKAKKIINSLSCFLCSLGFFIALLYFCTFIADIVTCLTAQDSTFGIIFWDFLYGIFFTMLFVSEHKLFDLYIHFCCFNSKADTEPISFKQFESMHSINSQDFYGDKESLCYRTTVKDNFYGKYQKEYHIAFTSIIDYILFCNFVKKDREYKEDKIKRDATVEMLEHWTDDIAEYRKKIQQIGER